MRTTKPISTISYNTPSYLMLKLDELLKARKISFWAYIAHMPEDDEAGKKEHCHVYIEPAKMLQTDDIRAEFKEFDPENPEKPKGCLVFKSSRFDPWYLYALHDKRYLASKGQSRKYHYEHGNMVSSNDDDLTFMVRSIDMVSLSPYADMEDAQKQGLTWEEYFARGTVPIQQIVYMERAWYMLIQAHTYRGKRKGHTTETDPETGEAINIDPETGEIIEAQAESPVKTAQTAENTVEECEQYLDDELPL